MTTPIYIVYKHTCTITGKSYIGQTYKTIQKRWDGHLYSTKYQSETPLLNKRCIHRWCKNPEKIICYRSVSRSKYLKSLKESPIGKTFREIGFDFEPI